ncbi:hypothetical protein Tco_0050976, partial [Tanacetum coccineum]
PVFTAAAPLPTDTTDTPSSTIIDDNAPSDPSSEESSSQGVIPSNLHQLNQSFDNIRKWTKDHPLDNIIGNPSRPVST